MISLIMTQPFLSLQKKSLSPWYCVQGFHDFIMDKFSGLSSYQFFLPTIFNFLNFSRCIMMWSVDTPWMLLAMVPSELGWHYILEYHQPNEAIPPSATPPLPLRDHHSDLPLATEPGICFFHWTYYMVIIIF